MTSALIAKPGMYLAIRSYAAAAQDGGARKSAASLHTGAPPYLNAAVPEADHPAPPVWTKPESGKSFEPPDGNITIDLPGVSVNVSANEPGHFSIATTGISKRRWAHRFAWCRWPARISTLTGSLHSGATGSKNTGPTVADGPGMHTRPPNGQ